MHDVSAANAAWIGFTDQYYLNNTNFWVWNDGTPNIYSDWYPSYPRNENSCAYMVSSGNPWITNGTTYWANDQSCSDENWYICKQWPICQ